MKKTSLLFLLILLGCLPILSKDYKLLSPDGNIQILISVGDDISYNVMYNNLWLFDKCDIQMDVNDRKWGEEPQVIRVKRQSVDDMMSPLFPLKQSTVQNKYNQLQLQLKGGYDVEFRAFNNGIAYRFLSTQKDSLCVKNENLHITFPESYLLHLQQAGSFKTAYEEPYDHVMSDKWETSKSAVAMLPLLIDTQKGCKILMSE